MSKYDGQEEWRQFWNRLHPQERDSYVRLNVWLDGPEPAMDDADSLDSLAKSVKDGNPGLQKVPDTLRRLLMSNLFFELERSPEFQDGSFLCSGHILCRSHAFPVISNLVASHPDGIEVFQGSQSLSIFLSESDVCAVCLMYRKRLQFRVRSLGEVVDLCFRWDHDSCISMSGMPQTVSGILQKQGLDCSFGALNHGNMNRYVCTTCQSQHNRRETKTESLGELKRKASDSELVTLVYKKVCI